MCRFCLALLLLSGTVASAADTPNVVFILADDLGWTDLGVQGSTYYKTPNIDRLAAEGMRFTNGYTCGPNCQPTRAALLSGQYGPRTGVYTVGGIDRFDWQSRPLRPVDNIIKLPTEIDTIAESMKRAGYATGMFGKWHLGDDPEHHPSAQGFDEAIVSAGKHFDFNTNPKTDYPEGTYLADFLTQQAEGFLARHKDGPFFLYLPHYGVHSPYQAKQEIIARFKDKQGVGGHDDPTYAAMIASVDESVGRVVAKLEELGLRDNTLVIFSSDNGGVGGYASAGLTGKEGITNNAPLKGGKGTLYEGGVRVPYIFNWPGKIKPGIVNERPINSVDLYPTLLELASAQKPKQTLDGVSYLHALGGGLGRGPQFGQELQNRGPLFWHFPGYLGFGTDQWRTTPCGSIRDGDWKLIEYFEDGHLELYNLANDIGESKNLAEAEPERAKKMHGAMIAWRESVGAKLPTKNDPQTAVKQGQKKNAGGGKGKGKGKRKANQAADD